MLQISYLLFANRVVFLSLDLLLLGLAVDQLEADIGGVKTLDVCTKCMFLGELFVAAVQFGHDSVQMCVSVRSNALA